MKPSCWHRNLTPPIEIPHTTHFRVTQFGVKLPKEQIRRSKNWGRTRNHQQAIDAVAYQFYRFSRRDVVEIMEGLVDAWCEELLRPEGTIHIRRLGNLYIQSQQIEASGLAK